MVWQLGAWLDPVVYGDYPEEMKRVAGDRLGTFTDDDKKRLENSVDYVGVDSYTTQLVAAKPGFEDGTCPEYEPSFGDGMAYDACLQGDLPCDDDRCGDLVDPEAGDAMSYFRRYPAGLLGVLSWMGRRYPRVPILVAESGVGLDGGSRGNASSSGDKTIDKNDQEKISHLAAYWADVHAGMRAGLYDLRGIFVWSFLDNLEWASGFGVHFGLVHVDHTRQDLKRTPKRSAHWYGAVVQDRGFNATDATGGRG